MNKKYEMSNVAKFLLFIACINLGLCIINLLPKSTSQKSIKEVDLFSSYDRPKYTFITFQNYKWVSNGPNIPTNQTIEKFPGVCSCRNNGEIFYTTFVYCNNQEVLDLGRSDMKKCLEYKYVIQSEND